MPPASTVESAFVVMDKASGPVKGITRNVKALRLEAERAGDALDDMLGPKDLKELEAYVKETKNFESAVRGVKNEVRQANPSLLTYTNRLRSVARETDKAANATDRLVASLRTLGTVDARPQIHVDGLAEARLEIAEIRRELRALGRSNVTASVGVRRSGTVPASVAAATRRAGGGGGGASGVRSVGIGSLSLRPSLGVGLLAAGLPIAQSLGGAAGAGAASVAGAGIGAGAIGVAGYGMAAAGIGAIASVIAPAKQGLQDLAKAQKAYNESIADYGRKSREAARARWELAQAEAAAPAGGANLLRQRDMLASDWQRQTRPGQSALAGAGANFLRGVRSRSPFLAGQANRVSKSAAAQGTQFGNFLLAPQQMLTVRQLTNEFSRDLGYAENSAEHILTTFSNIARASLPFFHEAAKFTDSWTASWAQSTSDITATRRQIGSYVEDLKTVARVGGDAAKLVHDLFEPSRGPGRGMLQDFDATLQRWDAWAQRNPGRIRAFFQESVTETEKLAGFTGEVVEDLHQVADILGPIVGNLAQLGSIAGGAGLLLPTAIRVGAGRVVGRGGSGGSGGGGGGVGLLPLVGGGGAGAGAAAGASAALGAGAGYLAMRTGGVAGRYSAGSRVLRPEEFQARYGKYETPARFGQVGTAVGASGSGETVGARYAMLESPSGVRAPVRGALGRGFAATGRFVAPLMAVQAGIGAATTQGNALERVEGAARSLTFGMAGDVPVTGSDYSSKGQQQAVDFVKGLPGGANINAADSGQMSRRQSGLQREIKRVQGQLGGSSTWMHGAVFGKPDTRQLNAQLKALRDELTAEQGMLVTVQQQSASEKRQRNEVLDQSSVMHGASLSDSFQQAFTTRTTRGPKGQRLTQKDALGDVLHGALLKGSHMRGAGASVLGEQMLSWADDLAKQNPKLQGEVDKFAHQIEKRWSQLGKHIQVVDGQILTGTSSEWKSISRSLSDPAEQALEKVTNAFTAIQRQAVGSLMAMGYSRKEANAIVRGRETGGSAGAQNAVNAASISHGDTGATRSTYSPAIPSAPSSSPSTLGTGKTITGDGLGADVASAGARAGRSGGQAVGSTGLMGADQDLMPYAQLGASFGSVVTSGLRRGAITVSGNTSFHSSGDAIDMSGGDMMGLARALAGQYGSGLEELIFSPLGWGIKGGKRVPNSFFGADVIAEHWNHVHVADVDPRGATGSSFLFSPDTAGPGLQSISLTTPKSGLGGVAGAMADAASAAFVAGLLQKINGGGVAAPSGLPGGGITSAGGTYDKAGLAALWAQANPGLGDPNLMAAIALAESAGNPTAHNPSGASGLWQILGQPFAGNVYDPVTNARMAGAKFRSQGLGAWEAYTNGAYRRYGDGLGKLRSRVKLAGMGGASGGGGSFVISPRVHVQATEGDEKRVRGIVERRLNQFAQGVRREINAGREKSAGAMG